MTHHLILLKITDHQLPVTQMIHKFKENVKIHIGVARHVEENGANCGGS
jgi:hypothetical protein